MIITNETCTTYIENNRYHRADGPAVMTPISQEWWNNGICTREDGPARMFRKDGKLIAEFWLHGEYIAYQDFSQPNCDPQVFEHYWHKGK